VYKISHSWVDVQIFYVILFQIEILRWVRQGTCFKFCANLGKSAMETLAMIRQAFGEESMSRIRVFEWHVRFRADRGETCEELSQEHDLKFL
jgi:hypothetical protein